jgi:hypothetical protein
LARIEQDVEELSRKHPQQRQQVVITLTEEAQHLKAADLGLVDAEEIGDLGILKGSLTGEQLLELSQRSEVEEIAADRDVYVHTSS